MNRRDALRKSALFAGSAIAAPTMLSLLQACAKQDRLTWTPQFWQKIRRDSLPLLWISFCQKPKLPVAWM